MNPLGNDSFNNDPYDREPLPPEPHEEWRPMFVDDFTAQTIEYNNPIASEQDKQLAANVASGNRDIQLLDESELHRLEGLMLEGISLQSPIQERLRRVEEQESVDRATAQAYVEAVENLITGSSPDTGDSSDDEAGYVKGYTENYVSGYTE